MRSIINLLFIFFLLFSSVQSSNAAVRTLTSTGNWSNPAIWSGGTVPVCGDYIIVPAGLTLNIDIQIDFRTCVATYFQINGTMQFIPGNKIRLSCGSGVEIMPGGRMLPGGGGSTNELEICNTVLWKAQDGSVIGYRLFGTPFPLPVEFLSFEVKSVNSNVVSLNWTLASERNNDFFTVEVSDDGINFSNLIDVKSIGDYSGKYTYNEKVTLSHFSGTKYFRLSQTDIDGTHSVLETTSLTASSIGCVLYPNPIKSGSGFTISVSSDMNQEVLVSIVNYYGQTVKTEIVEVQKGTTLVKINDTDLGNGIFLIHVQSANQTETFRLIVE